MDGGTNIKNVVRCAVRLLIAELLRPMRLRKFKKKAEERNDLKEVATLCNTLGVLFSESGCYNEAIEEHSTERGICEALQDNIGEAVACRRIGECLCSQGFFLRALRLQNKYLTLAQCCNNKVEVQRALATLGNTYYAQADAEAPSPSRGLLDKAEKKFLQALQACLELHGSSDLNESEFMAMKCRLFLNLGLVYDLRGVATQSAEYLNKSFNIAREWRLDEEQYLCCFNMANQALRRDDASPAVSLLQQAVAIGRQTKSKPRQREALSQLAVATVGTGNYQLALHVLKKAHRVQSNIDDTTKLLKLFKAVTVVHRLSVECGVTRRQEKTLYRIHEQLGDAFTVIGVHSGNYASAITHYRQMADSSERMGLSVGKQIAAYVSLAQTYADNQQFDLAINSYRRELLLRGDDHSQICRTWLNISELEERRGDVYGSVGRTYMTAFGHAKKAGNVQLQVQVLRSLMAVQTVYKEDQQKRQTQAKLHQILDKHNIDSDASMSDVEEEELGIRDGDSLENSDDDEDNLSISDLTDSDTSDGEQPPVTVRAATITSSSICRQKKFKKNEKGETPLHVACISGNLRKVTALLDDGHPVNVRDHCGWTPLHEAANNDFPRIAAALLDAGADINDRGGKECGGITPLIDAAACGNVEIMRLLIKRCANVLAKDNQGCSALQVLRTWYSNTDDVDMSEDDRCQYQAMVRCLEEKTFITTAPTSAVAISHSSSRGDDGCRCNRDSSPPSTESSSRILSLHANQSRRASQRPLQSASASALLTGSSSVRDGEHSVTHLESVCDASSDEDEQLYDNPHLLDSVQSEESPAMAYHRSIVAVGSSLQRVQMRESSAKVFTDCSSRSCLPALLGDEETVGDDWLVDDVPTANGKRRGVRDLARTSKSYLEHKRPRAAPMHHSPPISNDRNLSNYCSVHENSSLSRTASPGGSPGQPNTTDPDLLECQPRVLPSRERNNGGDDIRDGSISLATSGLVSLPGVSGLCFKKSCSSAVPAARVSDDIADDGNVLFSSPQTMRVRVKVVESVFLIPIPDANANTVRWLCDAAGSRFNKLHGRQPFLTIRGLDGAILSSEDMLSGVVSQDDLLTGVVWGWNQPCLSDQYMQSCKDLGTVPYRNIIELLKTAESSHTLSLGGFGLRPTMFLPIFRALKHQTCIQRLLLSGNHLGDGGAETLASVLVSLTTLTHLDLSDNDISGVGLSHLVDVLRRSTANDPVSSLMLLEHLNLSGNILGNTPAENFSFLVSGLQSLMSLKLSACGLTGVFFRKNMAALSSSFQDGSLRKLDISHNRLDNTGLEVLFTSLCPQKVTHFNLAHTCSISTAGQVARLLDLFVSQGCMLQKLSLENCHLHLDDIDYLCRLPGDVVSLRSLDISYNQSVTTTSIVRILANSAQSSTASQLCHLRADGCSPITTGLPLSDPCSSTTSLLHCLRQKLHAAHPIRHISFTSSGLTKEDRDEMEQVWRERWPDGRVSFAGQSVLLRD